MVPLPPGGAHESTKQYWGKIYKAFVEQPPKSQILSHVILCFSSDVYGLQTKDEPVTVVSCERGSMWV